MDIYYLSGSGGVKLSLVEWPYKLQTGDFLDFAWDYSTSNSRRNGGRITGFSKGVKEKSLTLSIKSNTEEEYKKALNLFFETMERDVLNLTPGRLYVNGQYLICYVAQSKKVEWENAIPMLDSEITLVTEYPFWCSEKKFSFYKSGDSEIPEGFLEYPHDYPYEYFLQENIAFMENEHYAKCDLGLVIYGPCTNPSITINGHLYSVTCELAENDYVYIDTRFNTVSKYGYDGEKYNLFNFRNKVSDLFRKVPAGNNIIGWSRTFGFDILLFHERSEPKWIL